MLESGVGGDLKPMLLSTLQAGDRILALDTNPPDGHSPVAVIVPVVKASPMFKQSSHEQMPQLNFELDLFDGKDPLQICLDPQTIVHAEQQACKADCLGLGEQLLGVRLTGSAARPLEQMKASEFQVLAKSVDRSNQAHGLHVRECGTQLELENPGRFLALLYFETSNGFAETAYESANDMNSLAAKAASLNVPYLIACYVERDMSETTSLTGSFMSFGWTNASL